jgi:CRP-like cAMP-binding protein
MPVAIPYELIKEIADELDAGMKCFYHLLSGQIKSYPDEDKGHDGFDDEYWEDVINEIEQSRQEYIAFEGMESFESFRLMENYIAGISDTAIQKRFEDAIAFKGPFQNFKQLLNQYPELHQQWFNYKKQQLVEWVQARLEVYNATAG